MTLYASSFLGGAVRSIQKVTVTNPGSSHNNYTIAPVDLARSAVFLGTLGIYNVNATQAVGHAELTSSTNLQARSSSTGALNLTQDVYVVDFGAAIVKSVQRGYWTSDYNYAIATVNPAKCIVLLYSNKQGPSGSKTHTLTANNLSLSSAVTGTGVAWQVIEFY